MNFVGTTFCNASPLSPLPHSFLQPPPLDCFSRRGIENCASARNELSPAPFFERQLAKRPVNIGRAEVVERLVEERVYWRDRCSRFRQARKVETRFPLSFSFPARTSGVTVGGCMHARIVFIRRKWLTVKIDDLPCVRARVEMGMMQLAWIKVSGRPSPPAVRPTDHQLSHPPVLILLTF